MKMNFWWVNHKQTYKEETKGGYIWSPKTNKNGARNHYYENMRLVGEGDIIFSYANTKIRQIGVITKSCFDAPKPKEFGNKHIWNKSGYQVNVSWVKLETFFTPKEYFNVIVSLLPAKYAPLNKYGKGNQAYLFNISSDLGNLLLELLSKKNTHLTKFIDIALTSNIKNNSVEIESINKNTNISSTEKFQLVNSRRGQGKYKENLMQIEKQCRITGITNQQFLIASHIKPWRDSSNEERLDGNNGLLLSPHIDKLFDRGYISFKNNGFLLVDFSAIEVIKIWGIDINKNYGSFNSAQKEYLKYHRDTIFGKIK